MPVLRRPSHSGNGLRDTVTPKRPASAASVVRQSRFPEHPPAMKPGEGSSTDAVIRWPGCSSGTRCSTDAQDLTAQREALTALGVKPNRIYAITA